MLIDGVYLERVSLVVFTVKGNQMWLTVYRHCSKNLIDEEDCLFRANRLQQCVQVDFSIKGIDEPPLVFDAFVQRWDTTFAPIEASEIKVVLEKVNTCSCSLEALVDHGCQYGES
jgi:hypothetical protein